MKKMILGVILATLCLQPAFAQQQRPEKHHKITPEMMVKRMDRALLLTDEQEKQMLDIYTDMFEQRRKAAASREDRKTMKQNYEKRFSEVLSDEQMEKWKDIQKKMMQKGRKQKR